MMTRYLDLPVRLIVTMGFLLGALVGAGVGRSAGVRADDEPLADRLHDRVLATQTLTVEAADGNWRWRGALAPVAQLRDDPEVRPAGFVYAAHHPVAVLRADGQVSLDLGDALGISREDGALGVLTVAAGRPATAGRAGATGMALPEPLVVVELAAVPADADLDAGANTVAESDPFPLAPGSYDMSLYRLELAPDDDVVAVDVPRDGPAVLVIVLDGSVVLDVDDDDDDAAAATLGATRAITKDAAIRADGDDQATLLLATVLPTTGRAADGTNPAVAAPDAGVVMAGGESGGSASPRPSPSTRPSPSPAPSTSPAPSPSPAPAPGSGNAPLDPDVFGPVVGGGAVSDNLGRAYHQDDDGDGLINGEEQRNNADPSDADTDDDGLTDGFEVTQFGSWANSFDTDGDGVGDQDEWLHGGDPNRPDTDGDGLTDLQEFNLGTTLRIPDSDNDGLWDGDEVIRGIDPLKQDSDDDCVWDGDELRYGGNPLSRDTDGDGNSDGHEWTYELMITPNSEASAPITLYCSPRV